MNIKEPSPTLDPKRFISAIRERPEFLAEMPRDNVTELSPEERRVHLGRAIATSALSLSEKLEAEHGEYDLDANLFKLVGGLRGFHENTRTMEELRDSFYSPRDMPPSKKRLFYDSKEKVTEFNHTLREVINAGASRFNFNDLLVFMTNMHIAGGGRDTAAGFHEEAREAIIRMRNEIAVEQVLIASNVDYELGTLEQDASGADVIIEGTPIDVKASERSAENGRDRARRDGRDPNLIVWSHIHFEDYEGGLTLPYEKTGELFERLKPDLDRAVASYRGDRHVASF